jgi:hypothetical protein
MTLTKENFKKFAITKEDILKEYDMYKKTQKKKYLDNTTTSRSSGGKTPIKQLSSSKTAISAKRNTKNNIYLTDIFKSILS